LDLLLRYGIIPKEIQKAKLIGEKLNELIFLKTKGRINDI